MQEVCKRQFRSHFYIFTFAVIALCLYIIVMHAKIMKEVGEHDEEDNKFKAMMEKKLESMNNGIGYCINKVKNEGDNPIGTGL